MSEFRFTRPSSLPPIVKNLIIINVLVFAAQMLLDKQYAITEKLMLWPAMPAKLHEWLVSQGALSETDKFQPYQIATHMFAHSPGTFFHILFNMFGLWMFGRVLENVWGAKRFLIFYLASGVGAAVFHLIIQYFRCEQLLEAIYSNNIQAIGKLIGGAAPALGASGALMGIMAAFAYTFPNTELLIFPLPVPIKAKWAVIAYAAIDLFGGVANIAGDNIAHFAHLGGAITGFVIVYFWNKTNRKTLY